MNINNLYEAVPVEKELPPEAGRYPVVLSDGTIESRFYFASTNEFNTITPVTQYLRPVTRESLDEWLREFGEKVWDISEAYNSNIDEEVPDKQTALTELINQTLGQ